MRRVTFVISSLRRGGAEGVCLRLANAMSARGDDVLIVTLAPVGEDAYRLEPNIARVGLDLERPSAGPFDGLVQNGRRVLALRRVLARQPERTIVSFLAATNVLTFLATRGLRRRVIVCERNNPALQSFGRIWDALIRRGYASADAVTVNSREAARAVADMGARAVVVVPNPMPAVPEHAAEPETSRTLLFVGRLTVQKAPDVLVDAFARVVPSQPEWRLVIVGQGAERDAVRARAVAGGIAGRVDWHDHVADLAPVYAAAGAFVLPSRFEGTPNALLEAMAAGLPVVVSDGVGGGLDHIRDGKEGFVVAVNDAPALSEAMARLMGDAVLRRVMGQAARRRIAATSPTEALEAWDRVLDAADPAMAAAA